MAGTSLVAWLSLIGALMADDADSADAAVWTKMVLLVLLRQVLGGYAAWSVCLPRTRKKLLQRLFVGLLAADATLVIVGVDAFASKLPA